MRTVLSALALTFSGVGVIGTSSRAEALTYHYIGGLYEISNFPLETRPLFTTGYLTFDEALLPTGETLAGQQVRSGIFVNDTGPWMDPPPGWLRSASFQTATIRVPFDNTPCDEEGYCGHRLSFSLDFDDLAMPKAWNITVEADGGDWPGWGISGDEGGRGGEGDYGAIFDIPSYGKDYFERVPEEYTTAWYDCVYGSYLKHLSATSRAATITKPTTRITGIGPCGFPPAEPADGPPIPLNTPRSSRRTRGSGWRTRPEAISTFPGSGRQFPG